MSKLPSTRLDDRLNSVLVGLAAAALLVLTLDTAGDDRTQAAAAAQQAMTHTAATASAATASITLAMVSAPAAR